MIEQVEKLEDILEPRPGQTVYCKADEKVYQWSPVEGWQKVDVNSNITMSEYDMNKQIVGQLDALSDEALHEKEALVRSFCDEWKHRFYMLLCRELNYYTVFCMDLKLADEPIETALFECANDIGKIKAIDNTVDGCAIEIWVTNSNNETYAMYFFPYDNGVIVCG